MPGPFDRWLAPGGTACRFCRGTGGLVLLEPNYPVEAAFHPDCLLASWKRGETRLRDLTRLQEANRALQAQIAQLQTALRNRTPAGSVAGFAEDFRRAAARTTPDPAPAPKPSPKPAPKPAPEPEKPRPDRFSLIELE